MTFLYDFYGPMKASVIIIAVLCIFFIILSFFINDFIIQFSVFVILGILLLITTRSWLNKVFKINKYKTNLDRVIGMRGIVTEKITKNSPGEVKVDGKRWMAVSDKTINVDNDVKILEIDGVKLKVEKWED